MPFSNMKRETKSHRMRLEQIKDNKRNKEVGEDRKEGETGKKVKAKHYSVVRHAMHSPTR